MSAQSDREWARDTSRRLTALERSTVVRVGSWSLWEDSDGNLVAGREGRAVVLARSTDLKSGPTAITEDLNP